MPVDTKKARENWDRYVYARDNGHTDYVKKADLCEDYFAGMQWQEAIRKRLERQGKPVLTINETFATLTTIMGEQIDNRADIGFQPAKGGLQETAEALDKVWMHIASSNNYDWKESSVSDDGMITSRGFFDVRIGFDDQMKGEVEIDFLNPKNVVIDPDAEKYDPDTWKEVFITKWMSPQDIEALYNKADAKLLEGRPDAEFEFGYDSVHGRKDTIGGQPNSGYPSSYTNLRRRIRVIERQYKKLRMREHFVDLQTGDMRPIPETWDSDRIAFAKERLGLGIIKKLTEQIRWTVTADNVVLHDEWSAYKYFTVVPFFPYFRRGRTIGMVENLVSPQDVLNKSESQELHVINTTANSGWKLKTGSLRNMEPEELEQRGAETGLVLELDEVNDAEKILPNQVPTGLDRVSAKANQHIRSISNVSESQRGQDRADVAAKAIQAKQAAGTVNLRKPFENMSMTRRMVVERAVDLVQTYYVEPRILQITGSAPGDETEELAINQMTPEGTIVNDLTLGEYSVRVTPVPRRDSAQQSQFDEATRLRELGVAIPDAVLVENSRLARKGEVIKSIKELNGGGEPSQLDQQMAELDARLKDLEAQEKEVDIQRKGAEVEYTKARAVKTLADARDEEEGGNLALEQQKAAQEHALAQEKIQGELALQREKMQAELELKREQARQDSLLKRAEAAERLDQQERSAGVEIQSGNE